MLLVAVSARSLAGINQWTSMGPDGGSVTRVAWHPLRDQVAFAVTDRVFRTTDGGDHWEAVTQAPVSGTGFGFHPGNADRMLLAGSPLQSSADGGATFAPHAGNQRIDTLAVSADGGTVFGAAANKVYRSSDFGQTWTEIATAVPTTGVYPGQIAISPDDPGTLFLLYSTGSLFKSSDGGVNWAQITSLAGNVNCFAINPGNGQQILAATGSNATLWRSIDGGVTWSPVAVGNYYSWFAFDPLVPNRVVANQGLGLDYSNDGGALWFAGARRSAVQKNSGVLSSTTPGKLITGTSAGVEVSMDAGLTLQPRNSGLLSSELRAIAVSRNASHRVYASFFGGPEGLHLQQPDSWQPTGTATLVAALQTRIAIESIAVDPADSSIVYVGGATGVGRSADGGVTWARVLQGSSYFTGLAVSHVDPLVVYAASSTQGILRSPDGGNSWAPRNGGLPQVGGNVVMRRVFTAPSDPGLVYATDGDTQALYRSHDSGSNWARVAGGLPSSVRTEAVAFDPQDGNRLYLATNDGLYGSIDAGSSWTRLTLPINSSQLSFVAVDPDAPNSLVVGVFASDRRVIRSVDYGATWESLLWEPGPTNYNVPTTGALDPARPGNVMVGAWRGGVRQFQVAPDLALEISGVAGRLPLGSTPTLRVSVRNKAASLFAVSDAVVTLTLPAALIPGTVSTTRGSCTRTGQDISCRMHAMKVGETAQIEVPLTVAAGSGNIVASIHGREPDLDPADDSVTASVIVQPHADLRTTLAQPAIANRGGTMTLDAQVTNLGPQDALNARAVFNLPVGLSASSSGICTVAATTVTCELGTLPVNGSALIQLSPVASEIGQYAVSVVAESSTFDPDSTNSAAAATATVRPVTDLAVTLGSAASLPAGQAGSATVTVTNAGSDPVGVAVVSLTGTNLNLTSAAAAAGSCSISGGAANCSLGSLAAGASRTVDVTFTPVAIGTAQLSASVSSEALDSATANNSAMAATVVTAPPTSGGGSAGGGGALGGWWVLALLAWVLGRARPVWRGTGLAQ